MKNSFLKKTALITLCLAVPAALLVYQKVTSFTWHHKDQIAVSTSGTVISICMATCSSGMSRYALAMHASLLKAGVRSILICRENTFISHTAEKEKLPYITCSSFRLSAGRFAWMPGIEAALQGMLKRYADVLAIHCNYKRDVFAAKKLAQPLKIPVVLTHHMPDFLYTSVRDTANGVIAVSKSIADYLVSLNEKDGARCRIAAIPPFFDDRRIRAFIPPAQSRQDFFKTTFGVGLQPCPLLVKVAHLYANINHKNHPLLFQAMHELIYKRGLPVQVALAGHGPRLDLYKKIVSDLQLTDYVHFLGNTDHVAAVLHYADINVLASSGDAFPLVLLEGGFMRKPTLIARGGCGAADWLIIDKETGFLFENKNMQDLADKIAYVLQHPDHAQRCGNQLHDKVIAEFLPEQVTQQLLGFYRELQQK